MPLGVYKRKIKKGDKHWHDSHPWGYKNNYKMTKRYLNGGKEYKSGDKYLSEKVLELLFNK